MNVEKKTLYFDKGEIIYENNSLCDTISKSIFLIKSGAVCLSLENEKKDNLLLVLEKGDMFGLEDIFYSKRRAFDIIVLSKLEVEVWDLKNFIIQINISIDMARLAVIQLIKKLRMVNKREKFFRHESKSEAEKNTASSSTEENISEEIEKSIYDFAFKDKDSESLSKLYEQIGVTHKKGDIIVAENETDNNMYLVVSGKLKIYHTYRGATEFLGNITTGDFFGEMNLFYKYKRSATVEVESENCKLLKFTKNTFNMLFQLHPKWSIKLLTNLSKKIISTINRLYY